MTDVRIESFERSGSLRKEWEGLLCSAEEKHPFSTLEWLGTWADSCGGKKDNFVITARDGAGSLIGALPVSKGQTGMLDLRTDMVSSTGAGLADYMPVLLRKGFERTAIKALINRAAELTGGSLLVLSDIPHGSAGEIIEEEVRSSGWKYGKKIACCPVLRMKGKDYKAIQESWTKGNRSDVRRQIKRLNGLGELGLEVFGTRQERARHYGPFLEMHERRWRASGFYDPMSKGNRKLYYSGLIERLGNSLHFSALCLDGRPVSYHMGFLYNGRFYYYKPAYDIEYENYSPGKVHIACLLERGCAEGWSAFDFLRGEEAYKFNWTQEKEYTATFVISTSSAGLRFWWHTGGKEKAYSLLGGSYRKMRLLAGR